jgi:hypothetical protein
MMITAEDQILSAAYKHFALGGTFDEADLSAALGRVLISDLAGTLGRMVRKNLVSIVPVDPDRPTTYRLTRTGYQRALARDTRRAN